MEKNNQRTALVTGAAGFIGFHISKKLLDNGWRVIGLDCMSDYYDVSLKRRRESELLQNVFYRSVHEKVEATNVLMRLFAEEQPCVVIHLAAQAGVRYSIDNPRAYLESNIIGTFELLEAARTYPPEHMLLATTSSIYGSNEKMPYHELDKADHQMSFYAATKKSTESMAHSYSYLFKIPITNFRFFTVYGPWGRPDMALFKFTEAIINGREIDVYNKGNLKRDFTYIDDLVHAIMLLIDVVPDIKPQSLVGKDSHDSCSPVAPFRTVNIGNSKPVNLMDFIEELEKALGKRATKNFMQMQSGDVFATWADNELLYKLTGFRPNTALSYGIEAFVKWYKKYYSQVSADH